MSATFGLLLHFQLAALDNLDLLLGAVHRSGGGVLNLLDDVVALEHFAKDDVAAIQPAGDGGGDEELGAVGVLSRIGHAWDD